MGQDHGIAGDSFQSTHPRGVRRIYGRICCDDNVDFNPRTREGCDVVLQFLFIDHINFNPRTREGCDALVPTNLDS